MSLKAVIWCAVSTEAQADDEKMSLSVQEADGRAFAKQEGWQVLKALIVPGHSRRYVDYHQMASDAAEKGINAFHELESLWRSKSFDVLIVRDGDRFARTQSAHAFITENIILSGARIYSFQDGWVDENNFRMWIAMAGYRAAGEIDKLVKLQIAGKDANAARGVPVNARPVWSHKVVRHPTTGRVTTQQPDESKRPILEAAARLIIEGFAWHKVEVELYERYGYGKNGKHFHGRFFYQLFHNPLFWGHNARHYHSIKHPNGTKTGLWAFDADEPTPEGVTIHRNTHEPALTGQLAEDLKAELRRRSTAIRGKATPHRSKMFTGLLMCAYCGHTMSYNFSKGAPNYACRSKFFLTLAVKCDRHRLIPERAVKTWIDARLKQMLELNDFQAIFEASPKNEAIQRVAVLQAEIDNLEKRVRILIAKQAEADDTVSSIYDEQINEAAKRLKLAKGELTDAQRAASAADIIEARYAFDTLKELSLAAFWELPPTEINQLLHRLFGKKRLVVKDRDIIGVTEV